MVKVGVGMVKKLFENCEVGKWMFFFFFFKQKTAYEMCGRDWSSDVCSSDLPTMTSRASVTKLHKPKDACGKSWLRRNAATQAAARYRPVLMMTKLKVSAVTPNRTS